MKGTGMKNKAITIDYEEYLRIEETIKKQASLIKDLVIKNKIVFLDERPDSNYVPGFHICQTAIPQIRGNLQGLYKIYSDSLNEAAKDLKMLKLELILKEKEIYKLKNRKWYERI